jgi:hypothetical protein
MVYNGQATGGAVLARAVHSIWKAPSVNAEGTDMLGNSPHLMI